MVDEIKVDLVLLVPMARRIIERHELTLNTGINSKQVLATLHKMPGSRECKGSKWGPDNYNRYWQYKKENKARFAVDYPRDRAWWPTALSVLVRDCGGKLKPSYPWLAWHETIVGQPYPDFPQDLNWRVMIHQIWLQRSHEWRNEWEARFWAAYPDANRFEATRGTNGGLTNDERMLSYFGGFAMLEAHWEQHSLETLARAQDIALELGDYATANA